MTKSTVSITIDPYTHEKAKDAYDNFSKRVEELVESDIKVKNMDDTEMIEEEISELESKISDLIEERNELNSEIDECKAELNSAKSRLEQVKREKETENELFDKFLDVYRKREWSDHEDIPDYWSHELGKSKQELMEAAEKVSDGHDVSDLEVIA
jgi:chromosome segregation ATPase